MTLTVELAEKVEFIYRKMLEQEFGDSAAFDPISVEPDEDSAGEPTFRVTIVYDGEADELNTKKAIAAMTAAIDPLEKLGLASWPTWSFVPKHEYPMLLEMRAEAPWEDMKG